MASKIIIICVSLLMSVNGQILGGCGSYGPGWGAYDGIGPYDGLGYGAPLGGFIGLGPGNLAASCGGSLAVSSSSPISPTGLTVTSENAIEGTVAVVGQLPFLGAVATDGAFPTAGAGSVVYGCGDGAIGIVSEGPIAPVAAGPVGYGPGYGPGRGRGCGCNNVF